MLLQTWPFIVRFVGRGRALQGVHQMVYAVVGVEVGVCLILVRQLLLALISLTHMNGATGPAFGSLVGLHEAEVGG